MPKKEDKKIQVKLYLEKSYIDFLDKLAKKGMFGNSRAEVMRHILHQFVLTNAANLKAMEEMFVTQER
ncbi:MAG TPA: hypothetical protein EYP29_05290 [Thermoplasmata archaeon]|nr:hypothetical protein [Thermoplasmata archaeon]